MYFNEFVIEIRLLNMKYDGSKLKKIA